MRLAASRTFCTAGNSKPISTAMIAMTTSSSMSVKPRTRRGTGRIVYPPERDRINNQRPGAARDAVHDLGRSKKGKKRYQRKHCLQDMQYLACSSDCQAINDNK